MSDLRRVNTTGVARDSHKTTHDKRNSPRRGVNEPEIHKCRSTRIYEGQ